MSRIRTWSEDERNYIRINSYRYSDKKMAEELSRLKDKVVTMIAVRRLRHKLNVKKTTGGQGRFHIDKP